MRNLSSRETKLLAGCLITIFLMGNLFGIRYLVKNLGGAQSKLASLRLELQEQELRLGDSEYWQVRKAWLESHMPAAPESIGRAQGEMLQQIQDDVHNRKLSLTKQSLIEPVKTEHYQEIAVTLEVRGPETGVTDWLLTLQDVGKFQVIKSFKYEPDRKSREKEPQIEADVTLARWFRPSEVLPAAPVEGENAEKVDLTNR
ncbi:MAG: hypothetical protein H7A54_16965 [Akkermansiaceae bacterium]|nr:hypothetical protein [Verrucomicrobiae bacterium]MCP5555334.1 hypothetical protein [Akkermansiaceae bacterium]